MASAHRSAMSSSDATSSGSAITARIARARKRKRDRRERDAGRGGHDLLELVRLVDDDELVLGQGACRASRGACRRGECSPPRRPRLRSSRAPPRRGTPRPSDSEARRGTRPTRRSRPTTQRRSARTRARRDRRSRCARPTPRGAAPRRASRPARRRRRDRAVRPRPTAPRRRAGGTRSSSGPSAPSTRSRGRACASRNGRSFVASWSCSALVAVATTVLRPETIAGMRYASVLPVPVPACTKRCRCVSIASSTASAISRWPSRRSPPPGMAATTRSRSDSPGHLVPTGHREAVGSTGGSPRRSRWARGHRSEPHPDPRRLRHGRQRPVGAEARPAPHRGPRRGRGGALRHRRRCARARHRLAHRVRVLDRELAATGRRGAVPHGLQRVDPHAAP